MSSVERESLAAPASHALVEHPGIGRPETTTGVMAGSSLKQSVSAFAQSIQRVQVDFYTLQKILASSVKQGNEQVEDAFDRVRSAKTLFSEKAESSRKLLSSCYRHCGDLALALQMPAHERSLIVESSLESAKVLSREFFQYRIEYGKALTQFEKYRSSLVVSQPQESNQNPTTSPNVSTKDSVDRLFASLHCIETYLNEIITFWGEQAELLPSPDNHDLPDTWVGNQRALLDASSSIAESVDAMSVEPAGYPRPGLHRVPSIAQEERGILNALQWFWRRVTFTNPRVR